MPIPEELLPPAPAEEEVPAPPPFAQTDCEAHVVPVPLKYVSPPAVPLVGVTVVPEVVAPLVPPIPTWYVTLLPALSERLDILEYPPPPALYPPPPPPPPAPITSIVLADEFQSAGTVHDAPEVRKTMHCVVLYTLPAPQVIAFAD